jgi:exosortase family protein XrtF
MTAIALVKNKFGVIPTPVKKFLVKSAILYLAWNLLYSYYLGPNHIVDPVLTNSLGSLTSWLVQFIVPHHLVSLSTAIGTPQISIDDLSNLSILDGCNGLELFVFYIGFIFCFPGSIKMAAKYIIGGSVSIYVLNVVRCVVLSYLTFIRSSSIDTMHHYVFTIIVYGFIIFLWLQYLKTSLKTTETDLA